jgi:hypothetical protein
VLSVGLLGKRNFWNFVLPARLESYEYKDVLKDKVHQRTAYADTIFQHLRNLQKLILQLCQEMYVCCLGLLFK